MTRTIERRESRDAYGNLLIEVVREGCICDRATIHKYSQQTYSVLVSEIGWLNANYRSESTAADAAWSAMLEKYLQG